MILTLSAVSINKVFDSLQSFMVWYKGQDKVKRIEASSLNAITGKKQQQKNNLSSVKTLSNIN